MHTKNFDVAVKAAGPDNGLADGQFRAVVSAFNNVDTYGDVVMPGAFAEDLERWKSSGDPIPVIWSHDWSDPFSHIGHVVEAQETEKGLEVLAQMDLEDNPKAQQIYRLLKGRRVTQFSFAFDVEDAGFGKRGDQEVYELRKLKTYEVGPTLIGVNQETELLAVKAAQIARSQSEGLKAGKVLSKSNFEQLQIAYESIGAVLAAATPEDTPKSSDAPTASDGSEPSQPAEPSADEGASSVKSDATAKGSARRARARATALANR